jgi:uncharacterized phage protein (TIGR02220 family)
MEEAMTDLFGAEISDSSDIPYKEIIDYLNARAGTDYREKTKTTQSKINARWREGYRLPDFMRVIDTKVSDWKGDPDMEQYLCPDTLFSTKFEKYLNQRPKKTIARIAPIYTGEQAKECAEKRKELAADKNIDKELDKLKDFRERRTRL